MCKSKQPNYPVVYWSGNNSALIVIDGSVSSQGAFDDLNPNDVVY
jgi:hypothetical protein